MHWLLVSLVCIEAAIIHSIPSSKIGPGPSFYPVIAGNIEKNKLFIHGGTGQIDQNQLWELNLNTYMWSILHSFSDLPEIRYDHMGFFRPNNEEFCVYGGRNQNKVFNDIWCFETKRLIWEKLDVYFFPGPFLKFTSVYHEYMNYEFFIVLGIDIYSYDVKIYILDLKELKWEDNGIYVLTLDKDEFLDVDYVNFSIACADERLVFAIWHKNEKLFWRGEFDIFSKKLTLDKVFLSKSIMGSILNSSNYKEIKASLIVNNTLATILSSGAILYIPMSPNDIAYVDFNIIDINNKSSVWCANYSCFSFGGYYLEQLTNGIERIDFLNSSIIQQKLLVESFISPPLRTSTSLKAVHTDLYLFGGKNQAFYLNDLWKYSTKKNLWSKISPKGLWPSSRSSYAAAAQGDILVIWGGENTSGYLNDLFIYNVYTGIWFQYSPDPIISPSKRKNACIVLELPNAYIYGGSDSTGPLGDLWEYSFGNNSYRKLIEMKSMSKPTCVYKSPYNLFIVNENYHIEYSIQKNISSISIVSKNPDSIIEITYDYVLFIGGRSKDYTKAYNKIISFRLQNNFDIQIEDFIYNSVHTYYNSSIYIYGGGYLTSEFSLFPSFLMPRFIRIDIKDLCAEAQYKVQCSIGFEKSKNGECNLCEPGTYSIDLDNANCGKCDTGFYNPTQGSTSFYQCFQCPEGTYMDKKGSNICKACSPEYYCPVQSSFPIRANYTVNTNPSFQPEIVKSESPIEIIKFLVKISLFGTIGVLVFILSFKKMRKCLCRFDLYYMLHNFEDGEYAKIIINLYGGTFSVIFVALSSIFIGGLISVYMLDNQYEEKFIIHGDFSSKNSMRFRADFEVEIRLKDYGGKCGNKYGNIGSKHDGDCGTLIDISSKGISNQGLRPFCLPHPRNVCSMKFSCKNCEIESEAYVEAYFFETSSFAKAIEVNVTADSSIPESRSSSFNKITASKNQIFIGHNLTEFHFTAIPSFFSNDFQTTNTGYHIISGTSPIPRSIYNKITASKNQIFIG
ncbi:hypothetical protein SteCoe_14090 [Stentor coeruleus]|uniref:Tyrosine-protein kinase ephrin type A/B receptor-like domain-containing protein n=1 Tax=Stentor coeruleus TaxID=5963 RepID=A0A1R2C6W3_9CILI|nr:hypothetical protein SteCoe_14090 [Stentor coeruleus]